MNRGVKTLPVYVTNSVTNMDSDNYERYMIILKEININKNIKIYKNVKSKDVAGYTTLSVRGI